MCEECYSAVCFEGCPFLRDKLARAACELCSEPICQGDRYYQRGAHHVCAACAERLSIEELLALGDLQEVGDLLDLLGFQYKAS